MTRIRPCIDLHEGQVKQIVGSSLKVAGETTGGDHSNNTTAHSDSTVVVNFASDQPPAYFSQLYRDDHFAPGSGHVILLGPASPANTLAAQQVLASWPGGWQVGGRITDQNCLAWIDAGASHVIVTSYLFVDQTLQLDRLQRIAQRVGREKLVIDLSCRRKKVVVLSKEEEEDSTATTFTEDPYYYVVTNQWQTFTNTPVTRATLHQLAQYCCEFLVHAVDVEGKQAGIQQDLVEYLGQHSPIPVTYAGGVRNLSDLDLVETLSKGKVDVTVGSALDIFGGSLPYRKVVEWNQLRR